MARSKKIETTADVQAVVDAGHTKETFDWNSWLDSGGVKVAEAPLDLYLDQDAAYRILQLRIKLAGLDQEVLGLKAAHQRDLAGPPEDEMQDLEDRRDAMLEEIAGLEAAKTEHSVTLQCRGTAPAWRKIVDKQAERKLGKKKDLTPELEEEVNDWKNAELLRKFVLSITNHEHGVVMENPTNEFLQSFIEMLPELEHKRLWNHYALVNFGGELADRSETAGFSGGSTDMAVESADSDGDEDGDLDGEEA